MPLFDHFRPPVDADLPWDSLHSAWATYLASALNQRWLPRQCKFANFQREYGYRPDLSRTRLAESPGQELTCIIHGRPGREARSHQSGSPG